MAKTSKTSSPELAKYTEEINESLKDDHKEQVEVLIPIRPTGKLEKAGILITSSKLRKISGDHASRIHGGRNDSYCQYLRKLACRQVVDHHESVERYS
ncbi:5898_t:CDS:2, partial [Funneliformis geosporum]